MISVTNLSYERYFEPVFEPTSFELGPGESLLVTGPNGCGKTTLLRLLAGILSPSSGELERAGGETLFVGHLLGIKDDLTVWENLRFMDAYEGRGLADLESVVNRMGLGHVADHPARSLSAGQRKRCALGRLLVSDARLWLLDEPYANLDHEGVALLDGLLTNHVDTGGACVLATHGTHRPAMAGQRELVMKTGPRAQ